MFLEDYQNYFTNYRHEYGVNEKRLFTLKAIVDNFIPKASKRNFRQYGYTSSSWYMKFGQNVDVEFTLYCSEENVITIAIKSANHKITSSSKEFFQECMRELGRAYRGFDIRWECDRKIAIGLSIWQYIKPKANFNPDLQEKYSKLISEANSLSKKLVANNNSLDLVNQLLENYVVPVSSLEMVDAETKALRKFNKRLERHLHKVVKLGTKESISNLKGFLERCPDNLIDYK